MAGSNLIKRYKNSNLNETAFPVAIGKARGSFLYDIDDRSYLDFTSGYGVISSGWLREEMVVAIQNQLKRTAYAPPWLPTPEAVELGELLLEITPPNLVSCARATGGADANEIIYKAVFACNGKKGVVSFQRSYHGGTHFTVNISDAAAFKLPHLPKRSDTYLVPPPYCYRCPFGKTKNTCNLDCLNAVEDLFKSNPDIGSFFIEPVLGSGGVIIPPAGYLERLRFLCTHYHVFLVFDEVITGFGRLGSITASQMFGIAPDAISFAKGMSSGYAAIGSAVLNSELAEAFKKSEDVSASFAWTPLSCSIAKANIDLILKDNLVGNAAVEGSYLLRRIGHLFNHFLPGKTGNIRGLGLMIGIELVKDLVSKESDIKLTQRLIVLCFRKGLMLCASWDMKVVILMPPLNITRAEIDFGLEILQSVLTDLSNFR